MTCSRFPDKGGNAAHNFCADDIGPNDHPGMDAKVDGIAFDAVSGQAVLWEVKTHNMANCRNDFCLDNLLPKWISEARDQLRKGHATAKFCKYLHAFGVGDAEFGDEIGPAGSAPGLYDTRVVRSDICLQPLK